MIQSLDIYTASDRIRKGGHFGTQYWTKVYKSKDVSVIFFFFFFHIWVIIGEFESQQKLHNRDKSLQAPTPWTLNKENIPAYN